MVDESTGIGDRAKNQRPSRAEWLLAIAAAVVIVGWLISWIEYGFDLFGGWFRPLSFFGSLVVLAFVVQKPIGLVRLPETVEARLLPVVSLLPVFGFLIGAVNSLVGFMTIGGSVALAYLSATTYWRKQFVRIASTRFTGSSGGETGPVTTVASGGGAAGATPAPAAPEDGPREPGDG